ncbi:hypothetical protein [Xanthomonas theicola]|uniref:hypothetical protein n=1 Tax=Xanthomonas theicola TaxID=56464 RepID=UPI001FE4E873|nr:hypothetical protein [Xanthomonas theicola]
MPSASNPERPGTVPAAEPPSDTLRNDDARWKDRGQPDSDPKRNHADPERDHPRPDGSE